MNRIEDQKDWRVWRDEEGQPTLRGRYGVISQYKNGDLDVWVKNVRRFNQMERFWKARQHWDDGGLFIQPYADLNLACRYLKCRKRRKMSPEQREIQVARLARHRFLKKNSQQNETSAAQSQKSVVS